MNIFLRQAVREQAIPFRIGEPREMLASDEDVLAVSRRLIDKNRAAYEELAK